MNTIAGPATRPPSVTPARPAPSRPRVYWTAFAVLMTVTSLWALATPVVSGPDENAHVIKAAAVVRGDLYGRSAPGNPGAGEVDVPAIYAGTAEYPKCFAFRGDVAADCAAELPSGEAAERTVTASTWVIRNNPAYYAVVGLPTLLPPGEYVLYVMRLVSAGLCSLVLAWGFVALADVTRRTFVAAGVATALMPMVIYLNGIVNSSGLEISAALTLWIALLALVRAPDPARLTSRMAGIAVVTVVLVNSRGLSPLYVAAIVVVVAVVVGPWAMFWRTLLDRRSWPWLGLVVAGTVPALWWTLSAGTLMGGGSGHPELSFRLTANRTFFETGDFLLVAIGRFGWLDTSLPTMAYLVFAAVGGFVVLLALLLGDRRGRLAMAGVLAVAVLLPVVVHAWQASNVGYIWTARYSMPLYVGVAATAGFVCRDAFTEVPRWLAERTLTLVASLMSAGLTIALLVALRRYAIGDQGSWWGVFDGPWAPPVPSAVLLGIHVVAVVAGARLLARLSRD